MDVERRKHVTTLIYARLPVFIVEFIWTFATTLIAFGIFFIKICNLNHADVFHNLDTMCKIAMGIRIAVIVEWILIVALFIGAIIIFNPLEGRRVDRSMVDERLYWKRKFFLVIFYQFFLHYKLLVQNETG